MDLKVYKKEEVYQPSGTAYVYKPDVIDIIPDIVETETENEIVNNIWSLKKLQEIADVRVEGKKLIINSSSVRYDNGKLIVSTTDKQIVSVNILEDNSKELLEQQCALATIFQRGLDPLDMEDGIRWSETLLGEVNPIQLMDDIQTAVAKTTTSVAVVFDTVTDDKGNSYLTYTLKEVA